MCVRVSMRLVGDLGGSCFGGEGRHGDRTATGWSPRRKGSVFTRGSPYLRVWYPQYRQDGRLDGAVGCGVLGDHIRRGTRRGVWGTIEKKAKQLQNSERGTLEKSNLCFNKTLVTLSV